jgi:hypothetical protein
MVLSVSRLTGCDDARDPVVSDSSQLVDPVPPLATQPVLPTSTEILEGPRTELPLLVVPLVATVPESWRVQQNEGGRLVFLEGQGPTQFVQIQLARRPAISAQEMDARLTAASKETTGTGVTVRAVGDTRILERVSVGTLSSTPIFDDKGNTIVFTSPPLRWTITLFQPRTGQPREVDVYELNFVGLTNDQYEAEKRFLREIVDSVRHDAEAERPLP